jgi:hypothetical protein
MGDHPDKEKLRRDAIDSLNSEMVKGFPSDRRDNFWGKVLLAISGSLLTAAVVFQLWPQPDPCACSPTG